MKQEKVIMIALGVLLTVLGFVGNLEAAAYVEQFDSDPGWTYSSGIYWENNPTHGGLINGTYYRDGVVGTTNSYCYTSDISDVMGKTVNQ